MASRTKQSIHVVNLLTVQGALDQIELVPLLTELTFLAQVADGEQDGISEQVLVNSTALHLAVHFDLESIA